MHFFSVSSTHLWHQIFEAGNDVGTLEFLVVTKATSYNNNSNQGDGQVQPEGERRKKTKKLKFSFFESEIKEKHSKLKYKSHCQSW